jgi:hypothetical protein
LVALQVALRLCSASLAVAFVQRHTSDAVESEPRVAMKSIRDPRSAIRECVTGADG